MRVRIQKRIEGTDKVESETVADFAVDYENELHSICFYNSTLLDTKRNHVFRNLKVQSIIIGYDGITILCEEKQ